VAVEISAAFDLERRRSGKDAAESQPHLVSGMTCMLCITDKETHLDSINLLDAISRIHRASVNELCAETSRSGPRR
jgi:hypothetical protein